MGSNQATITSRTERDTMIEEIVKVSRADRKAIKALIVSQHETVRSIHIDKSGNVTAKGREITWYFGSVDKLIAETTR